jgi:hypothetical protein
MPCVRFYAGPAWMDSSHRSKSGPGLSQGCWFRLDSSLIVRNFPSGIPGFIGRPFCGSAGDRPESLTGPGRTLEI